VVTSPKEPLIESNDDIMKFVGGVLCLDFVNTVDAWTGNPREAQLRDYSDVVRMEKLVDYRALVRWSQLASVLRDREACHLIERSTKQASHAAAALARALRLRQALYRILKSVMKRWEPEDADINVLHRELAISRTHERLLYYDGAFHWTWDEQLDALDRMLWPVAQSAAALLTSDDLSRLRQCRGDACGWMFLDSSRNRSRHWCDMSDCGNTAKVKRFRQRRR
jgi:predicted RNA-binding Zn ribbon-like protein